MVINPVFYEKDGRGNDVFSKNLENRVIHLVGEVTDELAASVTAQLLLLDSISDDDIYLYINSPGGSVSAGLAIYDTMQHIGADVVTICLGKAASMGAVILSGGTKGKRWILPHSQVMIHQPSGGGSGQATDILIVAEHIKKTKKILNTILADNCDKKIKQLEHDTERDYWMDAIEAVDYGIVDRII